MYLGAGSLEPYTTSPYVRYEYALAADHVIDPNPHECAANIP